MDLLIGRHPGPGGVDRFTMFLPQSSLPGKSPYLSYTQNNPGVRTNGRGAPSVAAKALMEAIRETKK